MNTHRNALPILLALTAFLSLPLTAASEICPVEIDAPSLLTVEASTEIALDTTASGAVVLEKSPTYLVIAASRPEVLLLESSAGCDLRTDVTRTEVRETLVAAGSRTSALVTTFHSLEIATKEEDHEIDPDPKNAAQARPLLTLIHLSATILFKEEDHEIDPDPKSLSSSREEDHDSVTGRPSAATYPDPKCGLPAKEEDHEIDPDPKRQSDARACGWARDWTVAASVVGQLGPGWYFVIKGGEVTQEILIEPRSLEGRPEAWPEARVFGQPARTDG